MAATIQIGEKNGAGATFTDKTSGTIRFKTADDANVDMSNKLQKPGAGSNWSFEKWLRFKVTGGSYTEITNLKAYSDGASGFGTGISAWAKAVASYATPQQGSSSSGYADLFGYTSGSPLSLGAGPFSGTGEKGDHIVALLQVASTAAQGMLSAEGLTVGWDEV